MTLDPQALTAAAEAEARYDGYDGLVCLSKTMRERYIDRTGAAMIAYQEAFADRWNMKGIRDGFAGAIEWIKAYRSRTGCALRDAKLAYESGLPMPPIDAGWQDISTAPKDGTYVLVFRPDEGDNFHGAHIDTDTWLGSSWFHSRRNQQPTHWQPLPLPPVSSGRNLADANSKSPIQAREE